MRLQEYERCKFCNKLLINNNFYIIYKLVIVTNTQYYVIGVEKILDDLSDFLMERGVHLSASQVILLRPDILKTFLNKKYYPEEVILWFLNENETCLSCFARFSSLIPEK